MNGRLGDGALHLVKRRLFLVLLCLSAAALAAGWLVGTMEHAAADRVFRGAYRMGRNSGRPPVFDKTVAEVLKEADEKFTYRGRPIHPGLVREFECWLSDLNPVTVMVDVSAANDTNEYSAETYMKGDYLAIKTYYEGREDGGYGYRRVRTTEDGVHVLETISYGGSSSRVVCELWVRFEIGRSFYPDGTGYDQLLMRLVRAK